MAQNSQSTRLIDPQEMHTIEVSSLYSSANNDSFLMTQNLFNSLEINSKKFLESRLPEQHRCPFKIEKAILLDQQHFFYASKTISGIWNFQKQVSVKIFEIEAGKSIRRCLFDYNKENLIRLDGQGKVFINDFPNFSRNNSKTLYLGQIQDCVINEANDLISVFSDGKLVVLNLTSNDRQVADLKFTPTAVVSNSYTQLIVIGDTKGKIHLVGRNLDILTQIQLAKGAITILIQFNEQIYCGSDLGYLAWYNLAGDLASKKYQWKGHDQSIKYLIISDQKQLCSVSKNNRIKIWYQDDLFNPILVGTNHKDIKKVFFVKEQTSLLTIQSDGLINCFKLQNQEEPRVFNPCDQNSSKISCAVLGNTLFTSGYEGKLLIQKLNEDNRNYFKIELDYITFMIPLQLSHGLIVCGQQKIVLYNTLTMRDLKMLQLDFDVTIAVVNMHDTKMATNFKVSSVQIVDILEFVVLYRINHPQIFPTVMEFIDQTDLLLISGSCSVLCFFCISDGNHCLIKQKELKGQVPSKMLVNNDLNSLIILDDTQNAYVWSFDYFYLQYQSNFEQGIQCSPIIQDIYRTNIFKHSSKIISACQYKQFVLTVDSQSQIWIWSLRYKTWLTYITRFKELKQISSVCNNEKLLLVCDRKIICTNNFLASRDFNILGPHEHLDEFYQYLNLLVNKKTPQYEKIMDDFLILPNCINVMHFYSYNTQIKLLQGSLSSKTPLLLDESTNSSPLSIVIEKGFIEGICAILKGLGKNRNQNFYIKLDTLSQLNQKNLPTLPDFYKGMYKEDYDEAIGECPKSQNLPKFYLSDQNYFQHDQLIQPTVKNKAVQAVRLQRSLIQLPFERGTEGSLNFLNSLLLTKVDQIFNQELIQDFTYYKWKQVDQYVRIEIFITICYLFSLCLHLHLGPAYKAPLWFLLWINIIKQLVFLKLSVSSRGKALTYPFNIIEGVMIQFGFVYIIYMFTQIDNYLDNDHYGMAPTIQFFLIAFVVLAFTRGCIVFRMTKTSRYLLLVITEIMAKVSAFIALILYFIFFLCFLFVAIQIAQGNNHDFLNSEWIDSFNVTYGNRDSSHYEGVEKVVFVIATIFCQAVLLNLIIAMIISIFNKSQSKKVINEQKSMLRLIWEFEYILRWRKVFHEPKFLQTCKKYDS